MINNFLVLQAIKWTPTLLSPYIMTDSKVSILPSYIPNMSTFNKDLKNL